MMTELTTQSVDDLRSLIHDFLQRRLEEKLKKIGGSDATSEAKRQAEVNRFRADTWLESAAARCRQIQVATHILKATHPDLEIKRVTNLYVTPSQLRKHTLVGTHALGETFVSDVSGNAAALDIYDFLTQEYRGRNILDLMLADDPELHSALSTDPQQARGWFESFAKIVESPCTRISTHTLAKQLYWPIGENPCDDRQYHLLAPVYASSLAHYVWRQIQNDRFSEEAKAARQALKENRWSERPVREYPDLAVQQLGGTKPQNISQLNSERRGVNYLLASLPPTWKSRDVRPLWRTVSMFKAYERRRGVRDLLRYLSAFLRAEPKRNVETRRRRTALVDDLIDELFQFTAEFRSLAPGWSGAKECWLNLSERHWLDPDGVAAASRGEGRPVPADTEEQVSSAFANWLNARLRAPGSRNPLPMGDPEFMQWRSQMREQIVALQRGESQDV